MLNQAPCNNSTSSVSAQKPCYEGHQPCSVPFLIQYWPQHLLLPHCIEGPDHVLSLSLTYILRCSSKWRISFCEPAFEILMPLCMRSPNTNFQIFGHILNIGFWFGGFIRGNRPKMSIYFAIFKICPKPFRKWYLCETSVYSIIFGDSWWQKVVSVFGFGRPKSHSLAPENGQY